MSAAGLRDPTAPKAGRVLIIDDDPFSLRMIDRFLEAAGFETALITDGETGIAEASARQPDLILLDIRMPRIDGFEICWRLKSSDATDQIPIIFISAVKDNDLKVLGFDLGAADYITKPFYKEEVLSRVRTHVTLRRQQLDLWRMNRDLKAEIEERRQAERKARTSESRFRALFDNAMDAIFVHDAAGRFVDANRRACEALGYSREELLALSVPDVDPDIAAQANGSATWRRFDFTDNNRFEGRHRRKDGSLFPVEITLAAIEVDGRRLGLGIARDIAERRRAERELMEREERIRLVTDNLPVLIAYVDRDQTFRFVNRGYERWFGIPAADIAGRSVADVLGPDAWEQERDSVTWALSGRRTFTDLRLAMCHGGMRHLFSRKIPHIDADGQVLGYFNLMDDITDRKEIEKALREGEDRLRTILDSLRSAVLIIDAETHRIVEVNPAAAELIGADRDCLVGRVCHDFVCPAHQGRCPITDLGQNIDNGERELLNIGGERIPILKTVVGITFGGRPYFLENFIDIRPLKEAGEKRRDLEARLRQSQKVEALGALAGGIAHDFNNILFPIMGYSEMLADELPANSRAHRNLKEIIRAAERARDLVRQILAFSRKSEQDKRPVQLQHIVKEALRMLRATIPTDIEILRNIGPAPPVMADVTQIHQVLMNLCTNAWHAMADTGGALTVSLGTFHAPSAPAPSAPSASAGPTDIPDSIPVVTPADMPPEAPPGDYVRICVSDTGAGMPRALLAQIFEPYFTTKKQGLGTGLGLAVVHGIIREHGGHISVASAPGRGSRFEVLFPEIAAAPDARPAAGAKTPHGHGERILLVDDEKAIVDMLLMSLKRLGYEVTVRYSSLDALAAFQANPDDYDLVITDMAMPNMRGDRLGMKLREIRPDIPVIICTGYSEQISPEEAIRLGFNGFLLKPVIQSELAVAIRAVLG